MIKRGLEQKNAAIKNHCEFAAKNAACVNGTIEITLKLIQHNIVMNLQHQSCCKFALCASRP